MTEKRKLLENMALNIRRDIIEMTYKTGTKGAHLGGSLSMVELLSVLFGEYLRYRKDNPKWDNRDRLILSKGHGAMALYAALAEVGIIDKSELKYFKDNGSVLSGHPSLKHDIPTIEFASGSLGQGLSQAVGMALGLRRKGNNSSKIYVILGDGECDEGQIWEAAMSAAHYKLNSIIAIVDQNGLQYDGLTDDILSLGILRDKWQSFGWNVKSVDGHDIEALIDCLDEITSVDMEIPSVIIADTIKGKGISFMENTPKYHNAWIDEAEYEAAMHELYALSND